MSEIHTHKTRCGNVYPLIHAGNSWTKDKICLESKEKSELQRQAMAQFWKKWLINIVPDLSYSYEVGEDFSDVSHVANNP